MIRLKATLTAVLIAFAFLCTFYSSAEAKINKPDPCGPEEVANINAEGKIDCVPVSDSINETCPTGTYLDGDGGCVG